MGTPPCIQTMASGNLSLLITEEVSWESFPEQAERFVRRVNGRVLRRIDTPVERMWIVLIQRRSFWLTFEDSPSGMSLDSMHPSCNSVIEELHRALSGEVCGGDDKHIRRQ